MKRQTTTINGVKYHFVAVDFDGCLCDSRFPELGSPRKRILRKLHKRRKWCVRKGIIPVFILWTCRVEDKLIDAIEWCTMWDVPIDCVNTNPVAKKHWGGIEKKIYADEYWDDKAVRV